MSNTSEHIEKADLHGWINLDKPLGLTSRQAVSAIKRILRPQKIGHAGTLDPKASGVLPLALGEATKTVHFMQDALKTYTFTVKWGEATNTDDTEGEVTETSEKRPTETEIRSILDQFVGTVEQVPPAFSAIKIDGERAYKIARRGDKAKIKARKVYVDSLEVLKIDDVDHATFVMTCGKGTYVRSVARDMAEKLGTKGHVTFLRRNSVGKFNEKSAISLEKLEKLVQSASRYDIPLQMAVVLDDIPALTVSTEHATRLKQGQVIKMISRQDFAAVRPLIEAGHKETIAICNQIPVAIVQIEPPTVKAVRVFDFRPSKLKC